MPQSTSPKRRNPKRGHDGPCPVMRSCGGCTWLGLPYRKQLMRKQQEMEELFGPVIGRFGWDVAVEPVLGMGPATEDGGPTTVTLADGKLASPRGFRYKAATPFAPGPRGQVRCGFFARGTHDIVACPTCAVEAPGARELLNEVARMAERLRIPAYSEDRHTGLLRYAILRCGWRTEERMLTLVTSARVVPRLHDLAHALHKADSRLVSIAQNINPRRTNAILGGETRTLLGAPHMRDRLLGCTFEISPVSFYQTNPAQTEVLYRLAIDGMELRAGDALLDAYCGSGTIGLCATKAAHEAGADIHLLGVERNPEGIRDARNNARTNVLEDASEFVAEDATAYMLKAAAEGRRVDVLSMDPPRAGSTPEFLEAAAALGPRRIVYISCNPQTQVRDLEQLGRAGYRLKRLTPVDMFPHTPHVETVATLVRG